MTDASRGDGYMSDVRRAALSSWERCKAEAVRRWGSLDRLAAHASPETAAKFASATKKYLEARLETEGFELPKRCGVMERGVEALEKEALENGYTPDGMVWFDLGCRVNGRKAVAAMNPKDAEAIAAALSKGLDEDVIVYTAADIVMMANETGSFLHHLKHVAGAYTTHVDTSEQVNAPW